MRCNKILAVVDLFFFQNLFGIPNRIKKNLVFWENYWPYPIQLSLLQKNFILWIINMSNLEFFFWKLRAFLVRKSCNIPLNTEDLRILGHFVWNTANVQAINFASSLAIQETWPCFNDFVWVFWPKRGDEITYFIHIKYKIFLGKRLLPLATPTKCLIMFT